jgi:protein-S-isoprenylcysteine O-methyltransferase Ste14
MNNPQRAISLNLVIQLVLVLVVLPFLPLLISGQWDWWAAWAYGITNILAFAISRALAARRHPDILAERAGSLQREDAKPWDKKLLPFIVLGSGLIPLVAGLDKRFDWPPSFSLPVILIGLAGLLIGYAWASYALIENRFFSGVVRIQTDRGHRVVSTGPYQWMRHPGYAGSLLSYLATPLLLDSLWALLPAIMIGAVLIIRTSLEDKTLQEELPGYREYTGQVRYRLLPGVW